MLENVEKKERRRCDFQPVGETVDGRTIYRCPNCDHTTPHPVRNPPYRQCRGREAKPQANNMGCIHEGPRLFTLPCNVQGGNAVVNCSHFGEGVSLRPLIPEAVRFIESRRTIATPTRTCQGCPHKTTEAPANNTPTDRQTNQVTICITHYLRPDSLRRCLASIRRHLPDVPIIAEDTEGNLSRGRNRMIAQVQTPYLFIGEEDFEFDERTDLQKLATILDNDQELGGVCIYAEPMKVRRHWCWADNMRRFRGGFQYGKPTEWRVSPDGTSYLLCDLAANCGLWRREVFDGCPWDEELELIEHAEWFWRLKQQEQWRVAFVPSVALKHWQDRPTAKYKQQRGRREFRAIANRKMGATWGKPPGFAMHELTEPPWPNIIVLAVGHANTTITARQLQSLGWHLGDVDEEFAENIAVRAVNDTWRRTGRFDRDAAKAAVTALPQPWAAKDPRFARGCLVHWLPVLAPYRPLLVRVTKDTETVYQSYRRRGELVTRDKIRRWESIAQHQCEQWPWEKLSIDAENIGEACELWQS